VKLLGRKYSTIEMDNESMATLVDPIHTVCPTNYVELLEEPITSEEILTALRSHARHQSPGIDGICLEFYTANLETIHADLLQLLNYMFQNKHISPPTETWNRNVFPRIMETTRLIVIDPPPSLTLNINCWIEFWSVAFDTFSPISSRTDDFVDFLATPCWIQLPTSAIFSPTPK